MKEEVKKLMEEAGHNKDVSRLIDIEMKLGIYLTTALEYEAEAYELYLLKEQDRKITVAAYIDNSPDSATKSKELAFVKCPKEFREEAEQKARYNTIKLNRMALDSFIDILKQKVSHYKKEAEITKFRGN